jgi:uncharacterized protein
MKIMADLIRRDRPADGVMTSMTDAGANLQGKFAKAGRNDPCPCGSGLKFKKCHGK